MVTRASEGMQIVGILMRYMKIGELRRMLKEMDNEVADTTDNESLRDSIKMVRKYIDG
jgi:hypothetical protein|tara:strand:+ start:259 stop:432 length:174 start_codon:yes stop_codon:yes gene_type:complete